jgi:hypothetical protein
MPRLTSTAELQEEASSFCSYSSGEPLSSSRYRCYFKEGERSDVRAGAADIAQASEHPGGAVIPVGGGGVAPSRSTCNSSSISEITGSTDALDQCHRGWVKRTAKRRRISVRQSHTRAGVTETPQTMAVPPPPHTSRLAAKVPAIPLASWLRKRRHSHHQPKKCDPY